MLLFIGFQGKAAKGGVGFRKSKFRVAHIPCAKSMRSEAARNQIAEQDTEGRQSSIANISLNPTLLGTASVLEIVSDPRAESAYITIIVKNKKLLS